MPTVTDAVFVYGPWAPGNALFWKLEKHLIRSVPATVRGSLYRSQLGFPLFVKEGHDLIRGHYLELHEAFLERKTLPVECVVERTIKLAKIFAYLPEQIPKPAQRISRGDWELDAQRNPDRLSGLSEEQRDYLLQLSTASRVSVDPALYRQLIKLGLIMDSGTNWGLSPLGRAAVNYLVEASCPTNH